MKNTTIGKKKLFLKMLKTCYILGFLIYFCYKKLKNNF